MDYHRGPVSRAIVERVTGQTTYMEYDEDAGVWRWWFTGRDGVYREGAADSYDEASLAMRKAIPRPPNKMITPPGYPLRNRGGGGVAGSR